MPQLILHFYIQTGYGNLGGVHQPGEYAAFMLYYFLC